MTMVVSVTLALKVWPPCATRAMGAVRPRPPVIFMSLCLLAFLAWLERLLIWLVPRTLPTTLFWSRAVWKDVAVVMPRFLRKGSDLPTRFSRLWRPPPSSALSFVLACWVLEGPGMGGAFGGLGGVLPLGVKLLALAFILDMAGPPGRWSWCIRRSWKERETGNENNPRCAGVAVGGLWVFAGLSRRWQ